MNKNLKELIEFRKDNKLGPRQKIIYHIVCVLEDFEKRIDSNKDSINLLRENVRKLHNRIRKLEQKDSYYPMSEKEIEDFKLGGTD